MALNVSDGHVLSRPGKTKLGFMSGGIELNAID